MKCSCFLWQTLTRYKHVKKPRRSWPKVKTTCNSKALWKRTFTNVWWEGSSSLHNAFPLNVSFYNSEAFYGTSRLNFSQLCQSNQWEIDYLLEESWDLWQQATAQEVRQILEVQRKPSRKGSKTQRNLGRLNAKRKGSCLSSFPWPLVLRLPSKIPRSPRIRLRGRESWRNKQQS